MTDAIDALDSPVDFLSAMLGANLPDEPVLRAYEAECRRVPVSEIAEGAPDPDDIRRGYAAGVVWRGYVQETALPVFLLMYVAAFHDPRLIDVFTPTLIVTQMVDKYAPEPIRTRWLTRLKARDGSTPQGAVWVNSNIRAAQSGDQWQLTGLIDAPQNLDAELAIVSAHVDDTDALALFLVPLLRSDGRPNIDMAGSRPALIKSAAYLFDKIEAGTALIEEIDGLTLATNCICAVALAQRLLTELGSESYEEWRSKLVGAFAGGWMAVDLLNWSWREMPGFISQTARLFRVIARLARLRVAGMNIVLFPLVVPENPQVLPTLAMYWKAYRGKKARLIHSSLLDLSIRQSLIRLLAPFARVQFRKMLEDFSEPTNPNEEAKPREKLNWKLDELTQMVIQGAVRQPHSAQFNRQSHLLAQLTTEALARRLDAARAIAGDSISD